MCCRRKSRSGQSPWKRLRYAPTIMPITARASTASPSSSRSGAVHLTVGGGSSRIHCGIDWSVSRSIHSSTRSFRFRCLTLRVDSNAAAATFRRCLTIGCRSCSRHSPIKCCVPTAGNLMRLFTAASRAVHASCHKNLQVMTPRLGRLDIPACTPVFNAIDALKLRIIRSSTTSCGSAEQSRMMEGSDFAISAVLSASIKDSTTATKCLVAQTSKVPGSQAVDFNNSANSLSGISDSPRHLASSLTQDHRSSASTLRDVCDHVLK